LNGSVDEKLLCKYFEVLSTSSQSRRPESTRLAALHSLNNFAPVLQLAFQTPPNPFPVLPAVCALFDLLSDDEYEIRNVASQITATVLGQDMISTPMGSEEKLANAIVSAFDYDTVEQIIIPIICRINLSEILNSPLDSMDNLFAKERENVWRDEIYQLEHYLTILFKCWSKEKGAKNMLDSRLFQFALDGLNLIEQIPEKNKENPSGLGWDNDVCETIMKIALIVDLLNREAKTKLLIGDQSELYFNFFSRFS
jgi:hypothetical protein